MVKMNTFKLALRRGDYPEEVPYEPIEITVGGVEHTFAIHIIPEDMLIGPEWAIIGTGWAVSDPVSGMRICDLGQYDMADSAERQTAARDAINEIIKRCGTARFNEVIANRIPRPEQVS